MRMLSALAGSALTVALLVCAAGTATAASDPGWFDGKSAEEREAIVNYVYERTGHAPPHTGGAAEDLSAQMAQSMVDAGEDDAPLAPGGGALELVVGTRVGLMTRLTTLMPSIPLVAGVGTFAAGYAIGTGVRKLFATITAPDDAGPAGSSVNSTWITWYPAGYEIFYGARVQQSPGAYLYDSTNGSGVVKWWEPPCEYTGLTPPAGAHMQYGVPSTAECLVPRTGRLAPVFVNYPYLLESDVHPTAPLRPYDSSTDYAWEWEPYPPDPGATAVEDDLDVLDEDGNDLLRDQIDWGLTPGSQAEEEPVRGDTRLSEEDRACKVHFGDAPQSDPGSRAPEADPEAEDWDYDVDEFAGVYNPLTRSTQTVELRWGTRAWGHRHIVIGHGWDTLAAARTALALADPAPTAERIPGSFRYVAELAGGPRGVTCKQRVIVSYSSDSLVPPGRHIITSFVDGVE